MENKYKPWLDLVCEHRQHYPEMTAQDVYKLLYQGIRGPEHLIQDVAVFKRMLEKEMAGVSPDPSQGLYEAIQPLGPDSPNSRRLYRIHLRRWLCTGQSLEELVNTCLEAVRLHWGGADKLHSIWEFYYSSLSAPDREQAAAFYQWLQENDFPPVHHSEIFRLNYALAYRLVCL